MSDNIDRDIFRTYLVGAVCVFGLGYVLCVIMPPITVYQWITTIVQAIPALPALPSF